jgi:hypothetical protein
MDGLDICHR